MEIIRQLTGEIIDVPVLKSAHHKCTLMKENYIELNFVDSIDYNFKQGDRVEYAGQQYQLGEDYYPTMSDEFTYSYKLQFNVPYYNLSRFIFMFQTYNEEQKVVRRESEWNFTGTASEVIALIIRNTLDVALFDNGNVVSERYSPCRFNQDFFCEPTEIKTFSFSSTDIISALNNLASEYELEWWCEWENNAYTIHFGECDNSIVYNGVTTQFNADGSRKKDSSKITKLIVGENVGKPDIKQNEALSRYYYVYGSSRNIDQSITDLNVNSIATKRLSLPDNPIDKGVGSGESVQIYDDIYLRSDYAITSVRTIEITSDTIAGYDIEDNPIYQKYPAFIIQCKDFSDYIFNLIKNDNDVNSIEDIIASGKTLTFKFVPHDSNNTTITPKLSGFEFEVGAILSVADDGTRYYEFELLHTDISGYIIPNENLKPEIGDWICAFNIKNKYIDGNETEKAVNQLRKAFEADYANRKKNITYSLSQYVDSNLALNIGDAVSLSYGDNNTIISRINGFDRCLDYSEECTYEICSYTNKGSVNTLKDEVSVLNVAVNNISSASQDNITAIVTSLGKRLFLSKIGNDTAYGIITFLRGINGLGWEIDANGNTMFANSSVDNISVANGINIANFVSNTSGAYLGTDSEGKTYIEADKLYVRMKAYFDSLEINRVTYNCGKRIAGAAGIRISKWEERDTYYRCYYLAEQDGVQVQDGFEEGDLCFSESFNVKEGQMSSIGNRRYWRLLTGQATENDADGYKYIDLSKTDCEANTEGYNSYSNEWNNEIGGKWNIISGQWNSNEYVYNVAIGDEPVVGDYICQLGNKTNSDRQNAIIENVTGSTAPSYTLYKGISTYTLKEKEMFDLGYNIQTKRAYMQMYGDVHIGDRIDSTNAETASFISYSKEEGLHINLGNGKLLVKGKEGKNVMLLGEDNKIKNDFINLDPLTLTSAKIPTIGEIEGFAHYGIEPVEASSDSGAIGGDSFTVSANAITELLSIPTNPKTNVAYTSGKLSFSAYSEGVSNYNISKITENVYVEYVLRVNALTGETTYQKINVTKNNDYNYSFNVADLNGKKFRIRIEATWKASKSGTSQTAQLTGKATAYIKGYDKTNNLLYSPDLSQVPQQTIVGGNGFLSQGKGVLIHMQSTQEEYEGITQYAGVTFLAGNFGLQITTEGIKQTSNGGIEWNIGNFN